MKAYVGAEIQLYFFFIFALDGGKWSSSLLGRVNPTEEPPQPLNRRLGGPMGRSVCSGEERNLLRLPGNEVGFLDFQFLNQRMHSAFVGLKTEN
jgi:hypothetical protein